jgi:hypothetical protein
VSVWVYTISQAIRQVDTFDLRVESADARRLAGLIVATALLVDVHNLFPWRIAPRRRSSPSETAIDVALHTWITNASRDAPIFPVDVNAAWINRHTAEAWLTLSPIPGSGETSISIRGTGPDDLRPRRATRILAIVSVGRHAELLRAAVAGAAEDVRVACGGAIASASIAGIPASGGVVTTVDVPRWVTRKDRP